MSVNKPKDGKSRRLAPKGKTLRNARSGVFISKTIGSSRIARKALAQRSLDQAVYGRNLDKPQREARLRAGAEIIAHVTDWAGDPEAAGSWYRSQPIPALGGRTAEALVMNGQAARVREYLDHLSQGGHA